MTFRIRGGRCTAYMGPPKPQNITLPLDIHPTVHFNLTKQTLSKRHWLTATSDQCSPYIQPRQFQFHWPIWEICKVPTHCWDSKSVEPTHQDVLHHWPSITNCSIIRREQLQYFNTNIAKSKKMTMKTY